MCRYFRTGPSRAASIAVLVAAALAAAAAVRAEPAPRLTLFSPAEAERLRIDDAEWRPPRRLRGVPPGPRIDVKAPQVRTDTDGALIETRTPASLVIRFEPNPAPVNMGSLEVTARKGIFSKSLTDLLKPYVKGTSLAVDAVEIPAGKFIVEIAVADENGAQTVETFRLRVDE
ncbi:hypothetical protein L6Q96_01045 [Candidatus Binatia bacterium]|nr:hypothetical protein [Candidatus Binatia bacterium]